MAPRRVRPLGAFPVRRLALAAFGVTAAVLLAACNPAARVAALGHRAPLLPTQLQMTNVGGQTIAPNGWTNQPGFALSAAFVSPEGNVDLIPEVEFAPAGQQYHGAANLSGKVNSGRVEVPAGSLKSGEAYHWQIRAVEPGGKAGPWALFDGTVGFDTKAPPSPQVDAPTGGWVGGKPFRLAWTAIAGPSGIAGFGYSADRNAAGPSSAKLTTRDDNATITLPEDGDWFFHLRTLDNAGNWSPETTVALHRDSVPLKVTEMLYRTFAYNPDYDTLPIGFSLSKLAAVTITILTANSDSPLRTYQFGSTDKVKVEWDGKDDRGQVVSAGNYRFRVAGKDQAGNTLDTTYDKLLVTNKRIVVSLNQQKILAYDGDKVALESPVTTGGPQLPTPEGVFQILSKQTKFTFHSPWPKGSPFWYPDSPTNFAMMFDTDGYFIHDAPWRHKFGPGSNLVPGQPGEETSGTHGCVNVPLAVQTQLFNWTDPGTPVVIQQ